MEIPSDEDLEIKPREDLILLIKQLHYKLLEKPKTSEAQLKAIKNYYSKKSDYVCEMKKKYYEKMKQNPEWVEKQNKLSNERYHKKKLLAQTLF
jgi:DNA mismatch repair ATPase MutS